MVSGSEETVSPGEDAAGTGMCSGTLGMRFPLVVLKRPLNLALFLSCGQLLGQKS